ncbi:hypothetical protein SDC9_70582 [bioreactor metagenome]|uniref:Uncharacterized protein n=1 Tax=bioreactor metagenome TaxID=1076179 RepID=A0A644Y844_9ZZZZ
MGSCILRPSPQTLHHICLSPGHITHPMPRRHGRFLPLPPHQEQIRAVHMLCVLHRQIASHAHLLRTFRNLCPSWIQSFPHAEECHYRHCHHHPRSATYQASHAPRSLLCEVAGHKSLLSSPPFPFEISSYSPRL